MPFSMQRMRNRFSVMLRSGRARLDGRVERAITFVPLLDRDPTFTRVFGALFHAVDEELILGDDEVWSSKA
jgi:hypothetical protein